MAAERIFTGFCGVLMGTSSRRLLGCQNLRPPPGIVSAEVSKGSTCALAGIAIWVAVALGGTSLPTFAATSTAAPSLDDLSLEELSQVEVTSVSKGAESLSQAPASIYVISHDDIARAGVTSIAEALRLAPNLLLTQYSASRHVAAARGLGGAEEAQNFSNKMLILIDGRSVYSPLYSGVYLDVQDIFMEDIDRIEVISGPGATLWGANAMNGVINIITRPAYLTTQDVASVGVGDREKIAQVRNGATAANGMAYRVYAKVFDRDPLELEDGSSAHDDWRKVQAGYRSDWTGARGVLTTQGDVYRGEQRQPVDDGDGGTTLDDQEVAGGNLLARWRQGGPSNQWQLQAYYDFTERAAPRDGVAFWLRTYDVEIQHSVATRLHRLVWGAGARLHDYDIRSADALQFDPEHRDFLLGNVFAQDTIALSSTVSLSLGLKFERDGFHDWVPLPDARLGWRVGPTSLSSNNRQASEIVDSKKCPGGCLSRENGARRRTESSYGSPEPAPSDHPRPSTAT